jgi:hypothetical protein
MTPQPVVAPWPCAVCGREWRGFGFKAPGDRFQEHFCSFRCSEIHMIARAKNLEITRDETAAALAGGRAAGIYLDNLGRSDLSEMTQDEWQAFCTTLFAEACAELARQADASVPY